MKKNVLIIEDDQDITDLIKLHLNDLGLNVEHSRNGLEGFQLASKNKYDLIILDLMLPGMDGMSVCQNLRMSGINSSILMLTARNEELDKVLGLESGADDYITKPFSIREFIARVKANLRRRDTIVNNLKVSNEELLTFRDLEINRQKRKVLLRGEKVELTPKEFDLLVLLAAHPGRSYSREEILRTIWGYDFKGYEHTVNSHINRLRAKIETDQENPVFVQTIWGVGYCFNDELDTLSTG